MWLGLSSGTEGRTEGDRLQRGTCWGLVCRGSGWSLGRGRAKGRKVHSSQPFLCVFPNSRREINKSSKSLCTGLREKEPKNLCLREREIEPEWKGTNEGKEGPNEPP